MGHLSPSGGYASLTGPGETVTPGNLTQAGGFTVNDVDGDGISLLSPGNGTISIIRETTTAGLTLNDDAFLWTDLSLTIGKSPDDVHNTPDVQVYATNQLLLTSGFEITVDSFKLGFYGVSAVVQAAAPTTLADVITILTNLGLCA